MNPIEQRGRILPAKWDGLPVQWDGWQEPLIFCPPLPETACLACGMAVPKSANRGVRRTQLGSLPALHAFRCQNCGHDQVNELGSDVVWDLDSSDYGTEGSWEQ